MEVKKSQHKYVIGPKGNSLQEILERTGVSVEIPPSDSVSETVILRGEPEKLGQALTEVYAKVMPSAGACRAGALSCLPALQTRVRSLVFLGQQLHGLLRVCAFLASPVHHWQEGAEPGQNHSADAKSECPVVPAGPLRYPAGCLGDGHVF